MINSGLLHPLPVPFHVAVTTGSSTKQKAVNKAKHVSNITKVSKKKNNWCKQELVIGKLTDQGESTSCQARLLKTADKMPSQKRKTQANKQ